MDVMQGSKRVLVTVANVLEYLQCILPVNPPQDPKLKKVTKPGTVDRYYTDKFARLREVLPVFLEVNRKAGSIWQVCTGPHANIVWVDGQGNKLDAPEPSYLRDLVRALYECDKMVFNACKW